MEGNEINLHNELCYTVQDFHSILPSVLATAF